MFISNKLVFIELHKTGCSHIGRILAELLEGYQEGKHNKAPDNLLQGNHQFLGSVRNPWDWYVSLWSYGCDNRGALHSAVTAGSRKNPRRLGGRGWKNNPFSALVSFVKDLVRDHERWQRCYSEHTPENFQEWLKTVNDENFWGDFGEEYDAYPANHHIGLLTYRYLRLFCAGDFKDKKEMQDILQFEQDNCYIDYFVRNESLEADLVSVLREIDPTSEESSLIEKINSFGRTNTSSRKKNIAYYYDQESIDLVAKRDKLIIDKFDYQPPIL